ncbi:hypothetical protein AB1L88_00950 [Tautonia sp. JC769]|uniref:hypothetical protein n=1 Tax=Tautonia sp. JC769 TaxID=3232135 RepID=UPI003458B8B9
MSRIDDVNAPKTLELPSLPSPIPDVLVLSAWGGLAGFLAIALHYAAFRLDPTGRTTVIEALVLPGIPFGIASVIPFRGLVRAWWPRALLAAATGGMAHVSGIVAAESTGYLSVVAAGVTSALVAGVGLLAALGRFDRPGLLGAMVGAGTAIGLLFMLPIVFGLGNAFFGLWIFGFFPIWQAAVAAPLGLLRAELRDA